MLMVEQYQVDTGQGSGDNNHGIEVVQSKYKTCTKYASCSDCIAEKNLLEKNFEYLCRHT